MKPNTTSGSMQWVLDGSLTNDRSSLKSFTGKRQSPDHPFSISHHQFPVHLAFALTINRPQGQSAKYVGHDLQGLVFAHGQLYVGLSQASSSHCIKVLTNPEKKSTLYIMWCTQKYFFSE